MGSSFRNSPLLLKLEWNPVLLLVAAVDRGKGAVDAELRRWLAKRSYSLR